MYNNIRKIVEDKCDTTWRNEDIVNQLSNKIEERLGPIPEPDYSADNDSQSTVNGTDDFSCNVCGRVFQYEIKYTPPSPQTQVEFS